MTNLQVDQNLIYNVGIGGISLQQGISNSFFRGNVIIQAAGESIDITNYDSGVCSNIPGDGTGQICPYDQTGNLFENNVFYQTGNNFQTGGTTGSSCPPGIANCNDYTIAVSNTSPGQAGNLGGNTFRNNVIVNYGWSNRTEQVFFFNGNGNYACSALCLGWAATDAFDHNIFFHADGNGGNNILYAGAMYTSSTASAVTTMTNAIVADPKFVSDSPTYWNNLGQFNFALQSSSPAVSAGTAVGAPVYDLLGNTFNTPPSIGAYEYGSTGVLSSAKVITSFNFNSLSPAVTGVVNEGAHTIALTVPYGTDVTTLVPTITIIGASVSPNSGVAQNFTSPVTYIVTAADSSTQPYVVTVTVASASTYTLTLSSLYGTVSKSPDQSTYNSGDSVTLTATPTSGYAFSSWSGDVSGSTNPLSITMNANKNITANYTVVSSGGGSSGGGGGGGYIAPNVTITNFSATPYNGSVTLSWTKPTDSTFVKAIIVRKLGSFSTSTTDGINIYQGTSTSFIDTNLINGTTYYYSAFSQTTSGISSTAKATAFSTPNGQSITLPIIPSINPTTTTTCSTNTSTISLTRNLSRGSEGSDVTALQKFLVRKNFLTSNSISGYFGIVTETAVKAFQKSQGIISSGTPATTGYGNVGSKTRAKIISLTTSTICAPTQTNTVVPASTAYNFVRDLSLNMTGEDVRNLQKYLNANGFIISKTRVGSSGKESTLFGMMTYKALQKFQKSVGLPATGFFGPMTRAYINKQ